MPNFPSLPIKQILTLVDHRDAGLEVIMICQSGHSHLIDYAMELAISGDVDLNYEWGRSRVCATCGVVGASKIVQEAAIKGKPRQ